MPMRVDCKHYESRTYGSGDTVRQCRLDLAPEAPWRCPADCKAFEVRLVDVAWNYGSLASAMVQPPEPPRLDADTAALLDDAENIINAVGPSIVAEVQEERAKRRAEEARSSSKWWKRFRPGGPR